MGISFDALISQYEACSQEKKIFLASSSQGLSFSNKNWVVRFLNFLFKQASFDLTISTNILLERSCALLKPPRDVPLSELVAALKVMKVAESILFHAIEKTNDAQKSSERTKAHTSVARQLDLLASEVGKKEQKNKIEVLFTYGCFSALLSLLKREEYPKDVDPLRMEPVLQLACERKEVEVALKLVHNNVSTKGLHNIGPDYIKHLAQEACVRSDDEALSRFVEEQEIVNQDSDLFLRAVENGLVASVKKFIEKGNINPESFDEEKNTALHKAFLIGNKDLVRFLLQHCNPSAENKHSQTPLKALLDPKGINEETLQIAASQVSEFLEEVLGSDEIDSKHLSDATISRLTDGKLSSPLSCDPVVLCFLLQAPLMKLSDVMRREEIEASISSLKKNYPAWNIERFFLSSFSLYNSHLKTGCEQVSIPPQVPGDTELEAMVSLFNDLPWNELDVSRLYEAVLEKKVPLEHRGIEKEVLRKELDTFLRKVQSKEVFTGTPSGGAALEEFYAQIKLAVRHSASKLLQEKKIEITLSFMKEILTASKYCGGRYFQTAVNQYLRICQGREETPRGIFERLLAEYRRICFEGVVGDLYHGYVHALTQATKDLGKELGIPGAHITFDDIYVEKGYNQEAVRKSFFKAYTPAAILFDHLIPTLEHSDEAKTAYIDLQKEAMPPSWNGEKYGKIYAELKKLPRNLGEEEKVKAENVILEQYDIVRAPQQTANQAIEEDRRDDFLGTFVYDQEGKLTIQGMVFLLERLGIITSLIPWKDRSKEVSIMPRRGAYREISIWETAVSTIKSFFRSLFKGSGRL